MNYRLVVNQLGLLLALLSAVLLILACFSFALEYSTVKHLSTESAIALAGVGVGGLLLGGAVWFLARCQNQLLGRREALLLVAVSWILGAAFTALPFFVWAHLVGDHLPDNPFRNFFNCYFESMSGLTTTGATTLTNIEAVPPSMLLWRASLQWLGGLGIVVLFVAVLPSLGVVGKKLYRVEAGTSRQGLQPQIRETARILWYIYLGMTVVQILLLMLFGMPLFDSICHTFATLATGGFSPRNDSLASDSFNYGIMITLIVFMFLGSLNFGLYNQLLRRRFAQVWRDVELRSYLVMLAICVVLVAIALLISGKPLHIVGGNETMPVNTLDAGIQSAFTVVSIQSTTGFVTTDFDIWPFLARAILVFCMFVGGCSGSTGGGIKVIRLWIVLRVMFSEIERVFRPQVIRPVRIGGSVLDPDLKLAALAYVLGAVFILGVGSVLVMLFEQVGARPDTSFLTSSTSTLSAFSTIGPGLGRVGATQNFGWMTNASKALLSLVMLLGRLEVFAIVVLFSPRFWRND